MTKKRALNFSKVETKLLVDLIYKERKIIENKFTNGCSRKEKELAWRRIEKRFHKLRRNTLKGNFRSVKVLKSKYERLKKNLKEKHTLMESEKRRTGKTSIKLNSYERKIYDMILFSLEGIKGVRDSDYY